MAALGELQPTSFLREEIDGLNVNAAVNALVPTFFKFTVPPGFDFVMRSMTFTIIDPPACWADRFGGSSSLTNGVQYVIRKPDGTIAVDLLSGERIRRNGDFAVLTGNTFDTGGNRGFTALLDLDRMSGGTGLIIPSGWDVACIVNDDLSGLLLYATSVQGTVVGVDP